MNVEAARWKKEYERVKEERNHFLEELSRVQKELAEAHSRLAELTIKNNVLFCENSDLKASLEGRVHEKDPPQVVPGAGKEIIVIEDDDAGEGKRLKRSSSPSTSSKETTKRRKIEVDSEAVSLSNKAPDNNGDGLNKREEKYVLESFKVKEETSSLSLPALPSIPPITSITPGPAQAQECSREESLAVENNRYSTAEEVQKTPSSSVRRSARVVRPSTTKQTQDTRSIATKSRPKRTSSRRKATTPPANSITVSVSPVLHVPPSIADSSLDLWKNTVQTILKDISRPSIDPSFDTTFRVSRRFLYEQYGAGQYKFDAIISPDRNPVNPHSTNSSSSISPERYMLFPRDAPNPDLPLAPGEPGIILTKRTDILRRGSASIFINFQEHDAGNGKGKAHKLSVWQYLGEYNVKNLREMSPEEFQCLPTKTQITWAKCMLESGWPCFFDVLVRIHARKLVSPSTNLTAEDLARSKKSLGTKKTKSRHVTIDEIIEAFVCGQETLDIILLECKEYDDYFARDMKRYWDSFKEPKSKNEGQPSMVKRSRFDGEDKDMDDSASDLTDYDDPSFEINQEE
ncbi:hypothetical protein VKT23_010641 [Stygiomarasmius scandens]|uniref:DUF6697 domain-containing protein n=1 Tax=Marasmiellus scandens TaxID=2682957 RepID=A0ABR1JGL6_9AGAR